MEDLVTASEIDKRSRFREVERQREGNFTLQLGSNALMLLTFLSGC